MTERHATRQRARHPMHCCRWRRLAGLFVLMSICGWPPDASAQASSPPPSTEPTEAAADGPDDTVTLTIERVAGALYRWSDGSQSSFFFVTSDGIVLGDPLNRRAAHSILRELTNRFPDSPVRYVVLSHHHYDRAENASIFKAEVVAHQNLYRELAMARHALRPPLLVLDRDGDGQLDAAELSGGDRAALLAERDQNADGNVTAAEIYQRVTVANSTYRSVRTIEIGGQRVELVHPGPAHSSDMTVMFFPAERVVFAVDPPQLGAPFSFGTSTARDTLKWLRTVGALDFDTMLTGDGETVRRSEIVELAAYLDTLVDVVADGYAEGASVSEILARPALQAIGRSPHFAGRERQVADAYRTVTLRGLEMTGAVMANWASRNAAYCAEYETCSSGGAVRAATGSVSYYTGRHFVTSGEVTLSAQAWSARVRPSYGEEQVLRPTRIAMLAGYASRTRSRWSYRLLGGLAYTVEDIRGSNRVSGSLIPLGGRHPIQERRHTMGLTAGTDIGTSLWRGVGVVLPVRMTLAVGERMERSPNRLDAQVGVGLRIMIVSRVQ